MLCAGIGAILSISKLSDLLSRSLILKKYINKILFSTIGLFAGAKLFGIISALLYYRQISSKWLVIQSIRQSGIVYLGGLIGFIVSLKAICKITKVNFMEIKNDIAVVIPLFHAFGRIGCFFAGCCYGKKTNNFILNYLCLERLPVQLYEAIFEFVLFGVINKWHSKGICYKSKKIDLLRIYLMLYSVWRFIIEFWRDDDLRGNIFNLSLSQIVSLIILLFIYLECKKGEINNE